MRRTTKTQLIIAVAVVMSLMIVLIVAGSYSSSDDLKDPEISWVGYTQVNGGLYGAVAVSNANSLDIVLEPSVSDGDAAIEAHDSGKRYLPPVELPFFPRGIVPANTNLVYLFPESRSPLMKQLAFIWRPNIQERQEEGLFGLFLNKVTPFLPRFIRRAILPPLPKLGVVLLEIPLSPNGTNADPILRAPINADPILRAPRKGIGF
jgi:hypothetical protein